MTPTTPTPQLAPECAEAVGAVVIQVRRRSDDWHAQVGDDPRLWAAGRTPDEAIGDLVRCHPEACGIRCEFHGPLTLEPTS